MLNRRVCVLLLASAVLAVSARPALAQQTLNVSVGHSMMRTGRVATDILQIEHNDFLFDTSDFNGLTVGGEWLMPIGRLFEAGAGLSFSRRTVPTGHIRVFNSDGSPITKDLGLRQVPIAFTARVLPLGQAYSVQPYVGGGVALIAWRFTEAGDLVTPDRAIFRDEQYAATGSAIGPVVLLGLRVAGETVAFGVEGRYQRARGSFPPAFARVRNADIDLGGWIMQVTAGLRLGQ